MAHADVYSAVSQHVPCSHMEWPNDSAPEVPWAVYYGRDYSISADNVQIAVKHRWTVELYEKRRDKDLEQALADTLRDRFGQVQRDEQYIENDNLLEVVYTFYEIEGDFDG